MKKISLLFVVAALLITACCTSCARIDAGHVGIKVKLYGSEKGVQDVTEVTGWVFYNPFVIKVFEVPTFVQNATYTMDKSEGSKEDESFRVTTRDGMVVSFDVSMNYLTPAENVSKIFIKYRKPPQDLNKTIMRNYLREAFNNTATLYTAEQLYEKRAEFTIKSDSAIRRILEPEGFIVEQIVLLNELRLPESVVKNVEAKVSATQIALQKQQEVMQARAEADKKIETSRGIAESMRIEADAEQYAFQKRKSELTPLLVQQMFISKWDGKLPVYGEVPTLFRNIARQN